MVREPVIISRRAEIERTADSGFTRRGWLVISWIGFAAAIGAGSTAALRFLFPNVLFEPPTRFDGGNPSSYLPGLVDTRWKEKYGVWIVRRTDGAFYALIAICKHLGCVPNWLQDQRSSSARAMAPATTSTG